jgi:hypothetical protein
MTLPAEVNALRPRTQQPGSRSLPEAARCAQNPYFVTDGDSTLKNP